MKHKKYRLPYVDNARAILLTVLINMLVVFFFHWPDGITFAGVMADTVTCVIITVIINMTIAYTTLRKMRDAGVLPRKVPESAFMERLPQNPVLLAILYIIFFSVVALALNATIMWFFGMSSLAFLPWLFSKLIYATVLSMKVFEYCVFRYVQPDWARATDKELEPDDNDLLEPVKDPLPKISVFKEMFGSVTMNTAMNVFSGALTGDAIIGSDASVTLAPTTIEAIPISGLVFGLITGALVTRGITKAVKESILRTAAPAEEPANIEGAVESAVDNELIPGGGPVVTQPSLLDRFLSKLPKNTFALMVVVCLSVMLVSAITLPAIMSLFGLSVLNFYQSTIYITVFAALLSKPLNYLLTRRLTLPDYVSYVLEKS